MAIGIDRLRKNARKLRKMLTKFPKNPSPEEVHKLRTRTRRLEANLHSLTFDAKRSERALLRGLKRIRSSAGKVRGMDVLTTDLSSAKLGSDSECLTRLLEHLGARRYKKARRLRKTVRQNASLVGTQLRKTAKHLKRLAQSNGASAAAKVKEQDDAAATALRLTEDLANPRALSRQNLHPYRLKVKELRYVLQMAERGKHQGFVEALGKTKDAIGEWHDWEELTGIAREILDHGPGCSLLRKLKRMADRKFEQALAQTNKLRREFVTDASGSGAPMAKPRTLRAVTSVAA